MTTEEKRKLIKGAFNEQQAKVLEILLLGSDDNNSSNKINKLLLDLGIAPNLTGFKYLVEAISIKVQNSDANATDIYYQIAENHNTTFTRVERGIRHAIEKAWNNGNHDLQSKLFGYSLNSAKGKPENTLFIARIVLYLSE